MKGCGRLFGTLNSHNLNFSHFLFEVLDSAAGVAIGTYQGLRAVQAKPSPSTARVQGMGHVSRSSGGGW